MFEVVVNNIGSSLPLANGGKKIKSTLVNLSPSDP